MDTTSDKLSSETDGLAVHPWGSGPSQDRVRTKIDKINLGTTGMGRTIRFDSTERTDNAVHDSLVFSQYEKLVPPDQFSHGFSRSVGISK